MTAKVKQLQLQTRGGFLFFLNNAPAGDRFVYHWGMLAQDRAQVVPVGETGSLATIRCKIVDELARTVWEAWERGEVILIQRKLSKGNYAYIAQKCGQRKKED